MRPRATTDVSIDRLIAQYIDADGRDAAEARLRDHGYAVWALIGDLLYPGSTPEQIAHEYRLPMAAVEAAWIYYFRHRAALDRRLAENRAT